MAKMASSIVTRFDGIIAILASFITFGYALEMADYQNNVLPKILVFFLLRKRTYKNADIKTIAVIASVNKSIKCANQNTFCTFC